MFAAPRRAWPSTPRLPSRFGALLCSMCLALAGCGSGAPEQSDAGMSGSDAGMSGSDAGMSGSDAGMSGSDAGMSGSDAGMSGSDAGMSGSDAGMSGSDAGMHGSDAGMDGSDAGMSGSDAGMSGSDAGTHGSDAGMNGSDAGMSGSDAGMSGSDAGMSGSDAGMSGSDAGMHGSDAGMSGSDAGMHGSDAGMNGTDAGMSGTDAGMNGTDAGMGSDAGADGGTASGAPGFTPAEWATLQTLSPTTLPAPPADRSNRYADNAQAAALGQKLFFETAFSGALLDTDNDGGTMTLGAQGQTGRVSCASCHVAAAGFLDDRSQGAQISLAAGWALRRSPSLLDVGQSKLLMWDGRRDALYNQVFGPTESPVEMNSSRLFVAERLFALYRSDYEAIFGAMPPLGDASRFPLLNAALTGCQSSSAHPTPTCDGTKHGMPGDHAEFDSLAAADQTAVTQVIVNAGKAIGAYERKLSCGPGRFDQWMHGNQAALSTSEQRGAHLFVGKGKCIQCHTGAFLSDEQFHNVGLEPVTLAGSFIDSNDVGAQQGLAAAMSDPLNVRGQFSDGDDGRLPSSVSPQMKGAFRTPKLRCVATRPSFMHTGQLTSLGDVLSFFSAGGGTSGYPGTNELQPLGLSAQDITDLTAFLGTLTGPGPDSSLLKP
jgi:cytochrome c peroxidase